jgi:hypothetical protein
MRVGCGHTTACGHAPPTPTLAAARHRRTHHPGRAGETPRGAPLGFEFLKKTHLITPRVLAGSNLQTAVASGNDRPLLQSLLMKKCRDPTLCCFSCGSPARTLCGRCQVAKYCDRACQKKAWKDHKLVCTPMKATQAAIVPVKWSPSRSAAFAAQSYRQAQPVLPAACCRRRASSAQREGAARFVFGGGLPGGRLKTTRGVVGPKNCPLPPVFKAGR